MTDEPESPCISVCELDNNDVCTGCGRTLREIGDWLEADDEQKRGILAAAASRRRSPE